MSTSSGPNSARSFAQPAKEHVSEVLAREYWRCTGLAESARVEARAANETAQRFEREHDKWQSRANEFLALLGGEIPPNPLPGSIE